MIFLKAVVAVSILLFMSQSYADEDCYKSKRGSPEEEACRARNRDRWQEDARRKDEEVEKMLSRKNQIMPVFSDYGTDMQSIRSYLRLMDSTSINACRDALDAQSMDSVYCLSRHSSGEDHWKSIAIAAKLGHPLAQSDLAHILERQKNPEFSTEINRLIKSAALSGIPHAQVSVGWWNMTGEHGFPIDYDEAMSWNLKAYNQGHSEGANNIGELYEKGLGVEKDIEKAAAWYQKASVLGNTEATQRLRQLGK